MEKKLGLAHGDNSLTLLNSPLSLIVVNYDYELKSIKKIVKLFKISR